MKSKSIEDTLEYIKCPYQTTLKDVLVNSATVGEYLIMTVLAVGITTLFYMSLMNSNIDIILSIWLFTLSVAFGFFFFRFLGYLRYELKQYYCCKIHKRQERKHR